MNFYMSKSGPQFQKSPLSLDAAAVLGEFYSLRNNVVKNVHTDVNPSLSDDNRDSWFSTIPILVLLLGVLNPSVIHSPTVTYEPDQKPRQKQLKEMPRMPPVSGS